MKNNRFAVKTEKNVKFMIIFKVLIIWNIKSEKMDVELQAFFGFLMNSKNWPKSIQIKIKIKLKIDLKYTVNILQNRININFNFKVSELYENMVDEKVRLLSPLPKA